MLEYPETRRDDADDPYRYETMYEGKYGFALIWCPRCERSVLVDGAGLACWCGFRATNGSGNGLSE